MWLLITVPGVTAASYGPRPIRLWGARPPFALERLRELDPKRLLYEGTKPGRAEVTI